jgi:hypothetical protein
MFGLTSVSKLFVEPTAQQVLSKMLAIIPKAIRVIEIRIARVAGSRKCSRIIDIVPRIYGGVQAGSSVASIPNLNRYHSLLKQQMRAIVFGFFEATFSRIALATIGLDFEPLFLHNPFDLGFAEGIGLPLNLIV